MSEPPVTPNPYLVQHQLLVGELMSQRESWNVLLDAIQLRRHNPIEGPHPFSIEDMREFDRMARAMHAQATEALTAVGVKL